MFIAVSNANGWGKASSEAGARNIAAHNSSVKRHDKRLRITVWQCNAEAYCDGSGVAYGITGEGKEYRPQGVAKWVEVVS